MKRYSLFLVSPRQRFLNYPAHSELAKIFGKRRFMIPLALPTIAALTPDHYDIRIFDEEIEDVPRSIRPDIVGITTLAATAKRAFELGDYYQSIGVKVVFGGPYASFSREEALRHADAVVVGEAEGKWEACLADFENGAMKQVYEAQTFIKYDRQLPPRWDLVNMKRIFQVAVQVSRGCPFNCDFCLVSKNFGQKMRYREIDNVIEEIKAAPKKYLFFVDDNLTINKTYAKSLMRALIPLKISWQCMCSLDVATDEELLNLMAEAGCFNILVGFESLNPESLDESHKHHNKGGKIYKEAIARIHAAGIHINASFVVGFDNDTLDEFDRIFNFTLEHNLPNVNLHLLHAPPGTETHRKLKEEGRLLNFNPEMGVGHFPTIQYANMSQIDIFDKYMETISRLYSFETIRKKGEALFSNGAFTRPGEDISAFMKARLSWITLKEYFFTTDPDKKKLFWFIIKQIRSRRLAIDKGLGFLLSMLGYHRHILIHQKNMAAYREMIMAQNIGALHVSSQSDARSGSKIAKVGIVGEGKMGSGIFYHLLDKGVELVWITSQLADLEKLNRQILRRRQRIKESDSGATANSDITSSPILGKELSLLSDCDLVIEAIPEDAEMKKSLFAQLDMITKPEAILVSNTSSIKPSEIAPKGPRSENFAGLHFFYPVSMKNIVEINCGAETSTKTTDRLSSFLNGIQCRYILLNEANSFMLNKIFLDVQNEAWLLFHSGQCSISQIDQMVKNHLFTFGIFDFFDSVGIDTMYASIVNYTKDYPQRDCFASLTDRLKELVAHGKLGVKSGEGFYSYPKTASIVDDPQNVEDMVNHLRQTWLSSSKRFTATSKLTMEEANYAIREYFDLEKGPFE